MVKMVACLYVTVRPVAWEWLQEMKQRPQRCPRGTLLSPARDVNHSYARGHESLSPTRTRHKASRWKLIKLKQESGKLLEGGRTRTRTREGQEPETGA